MLRASIVLFLGQKIWKVATFLWLYIHLQTNFLDWQLLRCMERIHIILYLNFWTNLYFFRARTSLQANSVLLPLWFKTQFPSSQQTVSRCDTVGCLDTDWNQPPHVVSQHLDKAGEADGAPGDAEPQEKQEGDTDDCVSLSGHQRGNSIFLVRLSPGKDKSK